MSQTVLVADDSQTIRKVVKMALKASAFDVKGVGSGREAMDAAQQQPVVILLDYYMPDASGYDVCRALKGNNATSHIPVIMLGGTYKNFDPDLARDSGAANVIMKPFTTDALVGAIEDAVNGAGALGAAPPQASPAPQAEPVQALDLEEPAPVPSGWGTPPPQQQPQVQHQPAQHQPAQPQAQHQPAQHQPAQPQPQAQHQPAQPPSQPQMAAPSQTPVPESQPRIPVQSSGQSRGSQPRISSQERKPTPMPGSAPSPMPAGPGMSADEIKALVEEQVKATVKAELPGLLRNVMGEVFQQKVLPKLLKHSEDKIERTLSEQLEGRISAQIRAELERLLAE